MTNPLRVVLAAALLAALPMVGAPAARAEAAPVTSVVAQIRQVVLRVEGLTCGGCALSARIVLERLKGVEKAEVDCERKRAAVTCDGAKVAPAGMIAALKETLGYTTELVEGEMPG